MLNFKALEFTDIDSILPMMQEFYAIDNYPIAIETSRKLFEEFIADEKLGRAWLVLENGEIVGYVILTFVFSFEYRGRIAFLDELYLNEKSRHRGIGKQVVDFIHEKAIELSVQLLYLEVEEHNLSAQKLYLSKDFMIHNRKLMKLVPKRD